MRWIPSLQEDGRRYDPNCPSAGHLDHFCNIDIPLLLLLQLLQLLNTPEIARTGQETTTDGS